MLPDRSVALLEVVCSIGADRFDLTCCLLQQIGQRLEVEEVSISDECRGESMPLGVHRDVEFSPCPALLLAVDSHFPLSFTIDFEPCGVDDEMRNLPVRSRQGELERASTPGEGGIIRDEQVDREQTHHGAD